VRVRYLRILLYGCLWDRSDWRTTNRRCSVVEEAWRSKERIRQCSEKALMENHDPAATGQVLSCHSQLTLLLSPFRMTSRERDGAQRGSREMMEPLPRFDGAAMPDNQNTSNK